MEINTQNDCIENYNVKYLIGRGSFGNVYKASVLLTGQEVAIKFIAKKQLSSQSVLKTRVLQEVAIHSRLKHPSILELYSYFEDESYIYLVLDLCSNGDLNVKLKNSPDFFTPDRVKKYMSQLVDGLLYLQRHRILHRDLTLSNLLLDQHLNIKICDFGLATRLENPDEQHFTMCGTPNYISPEVASRGPHGLEVDVWSVGCLFYTMVVGHPPFDSRQGVKKTLDNVMHAGVQIPSHIQADVRDLITCLLIKQPQDRIKLQDIPNHPYFRNSCCFRNKKSMVDQASIDSGSGTLSTVHSSTSSHNRSRRKGSSNKENKPPNRCDKGVPYIGALNNGGPYIGALNNGGTYKGGSDPPPTHSNTPLTLQHLLNNNRITVNNNSNNKVDCKRSNGGCMRDLLKPTNDPCKPPSTFFRNSCRAAKPRSRSVEHAGREKDSGAFQTTRSNEASVSNIGNTCHSDGYGTVISRSSNSNNASMAKNINESLGPPLNARRLMAIRQQTRNAVVNITKSGWVCLEFIKCFAGDDYVTEVMFVSADGLQVTVVNCSNGKELRLWKDTPVVELDHLEDSNRVYKTYSYWQLPQKFVKKYQYAARFVNLVRSKTPKITIYTGRSKMMLMENDPVGDFEAHFYDGTKVLITGSKARIISQDGAVVSIERTSFNLSTLSLSLQNCWNHACDLQDKCTKLQSLLESFHTDSLSPSNVDSCFPIIIGRRPQNTNPTFSSSSNNHLKQQNTLSPSSNMASFSIRDAPLSVKSYDSFDTSKRRSPLTEHTENNITNDKSTPQVKTDSYVNRFNICTASKNMHLKHIYLQDIGNVYQYPNGLITIKHQNGCLATLNSNTLDVSIATKDGEVFSYSSSEQIPQRFNPLVQSLPFIIASLQNS